MTENQKSKIRTLRRKGYGYGRIAKELEIPLNTVKSYCRRNADEIAEKPKPAVEYTGEVTHCENCGREIRQIAKRKRKRFCCDKCRNAWWNSHLDQVKRKKVYYFVCPTCGKEFHLYGDSRRKYCSHECYIKDRFGGHGNGR
ncbi:hypothetical protein CXIVA_07140 [Clostridium sp. SY8519]|uniref:hypothetical protein n=1 Tax=Clostridium sp. (strain SY8519) TaxID=1042156 RepID=UPI0002171F0D|nr:hypothetical protein [Clostridium sp. SY8519]BAK46681.1 hypothetical protein CXIVA_07140 [Clostridium sp. SY8519]